MEKTNKGQNFKDKTIYIFKLFDLTTSGSAPSVNYDYTINNTYKDAIKRHWDKARQNIPKIRSLMH